MNPNNEGEMTASNNRKRHRSQDQEPDTCAPLSKRINSLHIRCSRCSIDEAASNGDPQTQYNNNISGNPQCASCSAANNQLAEYSSQGNSSENNLQNPANGMWINPTSSNFSNCDPHLVNQNYSATPEQTNDLNYATLAMPNLQQCNGVEVFQPTNEDLNGYEPELTEKENPYYFRINKLLYDAHVHKVRRHKEDSP